MIVTTLHTDLRQQPIRHSGKELDPLQQTQLLFGEPVKVHYQRGEWAYVEALEQPFWREGWVGYGGWVEVESLGEGPSPNATVTTLRAIFFEEPGAIPSGRLYIGSRVRVMGNEGEFARIAYLGREVYVRQATLATEDRLSTARAWLGSPYVWGGLLPPGMGTDCSGLVHLACRSAAQIVPRDSADQYRACLPCSADELEAGDLVFTAKRDDTRAISHVILYEGGDQLLEAKRAAGKTIQTTAKERFGLPLVELRSGEKYCDRFLYFGKVKSELNISPRLPVDN